MNADYAAAVWQRLRDQVNPAQDLSLLSRRDHRLARQRFCQENLLALLLQYMGLAMTTLSSPSAPLWFASGTACGFIFLRGASILPGLFLGTLIAFAQAGWLPSLMAASIFSLQAYGLLKLSYRMGVVTLAFERLSQLFLFLGIAALVTGVCSALLALGFHSHLGWSWWVANWNGTVIIGCGLMTWDAYFTERDKLRQHSVRVVLLFGLLAGFCVLGLAHQTQLALGGIVILMCYLAKMYRWCGAVAGLVLVAGLMGLSGVAFISSIDLLLLSVLGLSAAL